MKIRFGYVANALGLWDASPSKALTFARYSALPKRERLEKLKSITAQNLHHTKRILHYNIAHEIELYRFSSSLVPLATHPEVMWDYITPFKTEWEEIGQLMQRFKLCPSFHPNQFTLFTSPREEVTMNAVKDMEYHFTMLEAMNALDRGIINIHIGGAYGDKKSTLARFHQNLKKLPNEIKKHMTLENDDKTYDVLETLTTCEKENIPMILDYHHIIWEIKEMLVSPIIYNVYLILGMHFILNQKFIFLHLSQKKHIALMQILCHWISFFPF